MSELYPSDAAPPEEIPPIPEVSETSKDAPLLETPAKAPARSRPRWVAPAWFFFGIIVGIAAFAAYTALAVKPAAPATQAESLDPEVMRSAARQGVIEAIATLQAGGSQQPSGQAPEGPQVVANNAFTVRGANRQGSANAKVTIFEFSDFQ